MMMDELRALDVWIAKYIMGYTTRPSTIVVYNSITHNYDPDTRAVWVTPDGLGHGYKPQNYSSDVALAWSVLQECQRHHVYLQVEAAMPQGYYGDARIHATGDEQGFSASTAPELICYMAMWAYKKLGADGWRDSFNPVYKVM